ncbi:hypothetical protein [Janthinobacterium sp. RA13]|uniref:hypothetical protein n=1 Tax=Janthinobacterium sp. RA13 TaxID=1502762 RepID=UPI0013787ECA|nr:hypothetical protein [Janthinobacterium sp. RA13]
MKKIILSQPPGFPLTIADSPLFVEDGRSVYELVLHNQAINLSIGDNIVVKYKHVALSA